MRITNAIIKNVAVVFDGKNKLSAIITFKASYSCYDFSFILTNPLEVQRLMKLMSYTGVNDISNLNSKIIRIATEPGYCYGFGHLIEDKFIPTFTEDFKEVSEAEFEELLKNN